jgi:hypothetical protein
MEMNPVVAVAAAAAAVVGGAALRHRHSNVAKQKQATSNPSSLGWNARPSPLLVAIRSTEGFLTLAPEQQQLLWTRLGCEGDGGVDSVLISHAMLLARQSCRIGELC